MNADTYRGQPNPAPEAYERLAQALEMMGAPCEGDPRFTTDNAPLDALQPICAGCPIQMLCDEYARAARPAAGVWAGRRYGSTTPGRVGRPRKDQAA